MSGFGDIDMSKSTINVYIILHIRDIRTFKRFIISLEQGKIKKYRTSKGIKYLMTAEAIFIKNRKPKIKY